MSDMSNISISQLKTSPAKAISEASDYPVAVQSRNKVKAYLIGKDLYGKLIAFIEDHIDKAVIKKTDFKKGRNFEKVAKELGI